MTKQPREIFQIWINGFNLLTKEMNKAKWNELLASKDACEIRLASWKLLKAMGEMWAVLLESELPDEDAKLLKMALFRCDDHIDALTGLLDEHNTQPTP